MSSGLALRAASSATALSTKRARAGPRTAPRSAPESEAASLGGCAYDVDAGADADSQPPFDLEGDQRLAHGRTRHAQHVGKVTLGRETAAHGVFTAVDELSQLIRDLAVEPTGLDGFQRQASLLNVPSGLLFLFLPPIGQVVWPI